MDKSYVTGSSVRNFILNDPIIDYLEIYKKELKSKDEFSESLMQQGKDYEASVINYLYKRYGSERIVSICSSPEDVYDNSKYELTLQKMKEQVPIIYQGLVIDHEQKIGGIPDLLVRNDWLNNIIDSNGGSVYYLGKRQKHYVVVDIKLSKLKMKVDGIHLLNSGSMPYYKSQLYIYTQALAKMQDFNPNTAFVLGRDYESLNCLERFGKIDYNVVDNFIIEKTNYAISWVRKLREQGHEWGLFPPSIPELRPNMSNYSDGGWRHVKKDIAVKQGDITMLWRCGPKKRKIAIENGANSWEECDSEVLEIKNPKISKTIDRNIFVNTKQDFCAILPKELSFQKKSVEFFLDYETISVKDSFENFPFLEKDKSLVFQIGCGCVKDDVWTYKYYVCEKLNEDCQKFIFDMLKDDIDRVGEDYNIFAWGTTEKNYYKKILGSEIENYVDLLSFFRNKSIAIKGVFNFSLKSIAKTLYENKCIDTTWKEGNDSAIEVMNKANIYYNLGTESELKDIVDYNEVDCKTMWEIVSFLRK